jgi:hypothetical protein
MPKNCEKRTIKSRACVPLKRPANAEYYAEFKTFGKITEKTPQNISQKL